MDTACLRAPTELIKDFSTFTVSNNQDPVFQPGVSTLSTACQFPDTRTFNSSRVLLEDIFIFYNCG
jgi:hypothetical protein